MTLGMPRAWSSASFSFALWCALLLSGCPGDSGNGQPPTGAQKRAGADWICGSGIADDTTCSCFARKPEWEGSSSSIPHCVAYKCCLLNETETESTFANCECSDTTTSCEAEAEARKGTKVVSQCPPEDEDLAAMMCAESGESCAQSYLDQNDYIGCCSSLVCLPNAAGIRTCQKGSTEQRELAQQCDKVASGSGGGAESFVITGSPLRTSVGDLEIAGVKFVFSAMGPGGCVTMIDFSLGATTSCRLQLRANVIDGKLVASYVSGSLDDCPGFSGGALTFVSVLEDDPAVLAEALSVSFEGLACDGDLIFESYCAAGTFDWHFNGTIGSVTFEDQHLQLRGVACNPSEPAGECPAP